MEDRGGGGVGGRLLLFGILICFLLNELINFDVDIFLKWEGEDDIEFDFGFFVVFENRNLDEFISEFCLCVGDGRVIDDFDEFVSKFCFLIVCWFIFGVKGGWDKFGIFLWLLLKRFGGLIGIVLFSFYEDVFLLNEFNVGFGGDIEDKFLVLFLNKLGGLIGDCCCVFLDGFEGNWLRLVDIFFNKLGFCFIIKLEKLLVDEFRVVGFDVLELVFFSFL